MSAGANVGYAIEDKKGDYLIIALLIKNKLISLLALLVLL